MEEFNHEVTEIETEAKVFINQSFKKLRSAEGAFEMLLRFKNIRSREAINNELMKKFTDILSQYVKECDSMFELFQKYKSDPPLYKNHPVVSGAIAWARFLFKSIKRPMLKFLTVEDLMNTEQGKETKSHYLSIARQMKAYEDVKYNEWRINIENTLPEILKTNLLVKDAGDKNLVLPLNTDPETGRKVDIKYILNYNTKINEIITESKYMEQLGFPLPEIARNLALQVCQIFIFFTHLLCRDVNS
jgi:dynein heavy chain